MSREGETQGEAKVAPSRTISQANRRIGLMVLFSVVVLTGLVRYRLADVPLERDEGEYAYGGQLMLEGVPPYQQAYTMKWPGICVVYAIILALFGQTHVGIHFGLLACNTATILFVYLLASHVMGPPAAAVSGVVFAVTSLSQSVQGIFANAEHFVILFSTAGLVVLFNAMQKGRWRQCFAAGLLLGAGAITKQHGLVFCFAAACCAVVDAMAYRPVLQRMRRFLLPLLGGILTVFTGMLAAMAWCGVFDQFWFWTIDYAGVYVGELPLKYAIGYLMIAVSDILASAPLLWVIVLLGIFVLAAADIRRRHKLSLLCLTIFSMSGVCPGGYFRPHYFILLLPCAALLAGVAFQYIPDGISRALFKGKYVPAIGAIMMTAAILQPIMREYDYLFRMSPFEVCRSTYSINPFFESLEIARYIREHTTASDRIVILGSEPQICFYAHRRSGTGYIYFYPLMEDQPWADQMQEDCIRQIEAQKPAYCIFVNVTCSWLAGPVRRNRVVDWMMPYFQANYQPVGRIDLFDDSTQYHWSEGVAAAGPSSFYVTVYKRCSQLSEAQ